MITNECASIYIYQNVKRIACITVIHVIYIYAPLCVEDNNIVLHKACAPNYHSR